MLILLQVVPVDIMRISRYTSATNNAFNVLILQTILSKYKWIGVRETPMETKLWRTNDGTRTGFALVPKRLESKGLSSKMLTPSNSPRSCRRSRPVACSMSVGTVPGFAPGPNNWGGGGPDWTRRLVENARKADDDGFAEERAARAAGRAARTAVLNMIFGRNSNDGETTKVTGSLVSRRHQWPVTPACSVRTSR